ncbi:MAG: NAD(P)H-binding protein, partial [Planctomycetota bacterium]
MLVPKPDAINPGSLILVTGASGYVGGRLVPRLLEEGYRVRCFVRSPQKLDEYPWRSHSEVSVCEGDLSDPDTLIAACQNVDAAYYLVHSMISAGDEYARRDRELASHFARAAKQANVRRVIYLGGLGEMGEGLSNHLRSRREVEMVLRTDGVPTTVLRAAMIIGSGSASFEILRYLVDRLPVMVVPKWVETMTQPIAIRDVLRYLVQCLRVAETTDQTIDIGGPDILTYREMMNLMCDAIGLRRRKIIDVPVLTPRLSSRWIGLVTPVTSKIARPLAEGLKNRTVCRNDQAQQWMPGPLRGAREAVDAALGKLQAGKIETRWSTAGELPGDPSWSGGTVFRDQRETNVMAPPEATFTAVCRIGGQHGYWGADWLWQIRGWMDQMIGG